MGLADRDYIRSPAPRRAGSLPLISVNTWLIIINVAVFIVGNVLLAGVVTKIRAGDAFYQGVTAQQMRSAVVDHSVTVPAPDLPGVFYNPIYERRSDGSLVEIGRERFRFDEPLHAVGHFATARLTHDIEIWRLITFQFLHANLWHLVFNMLGLWFVGGMVEAALGAKRYTAFYLICGACGALMYLFLNLLGWGLHLNIPGVLFSDPYTPLVGASAGVFGVLLAAAYLRPNDVVLVSFILPMRLRTAVYLFVLFAAVNLWMGGANAGGDAAHIGGALAGAIFARRSHLLDYFDFFGKRSPPVRPRPRTIDVSGGRDEVDRILAKIHDRGLSSITVEERATLHRARQELDS